MPRTARGRHQAVQSTSGRVVEVRWKCLLKADKISATGRGVWRELAEEVFDSGREELPELNAILPQPLCLGTENMQGGLHLSVELRGGREGGWTVVAVKDVE
jgi:hypothetical protein